jgi:hypothetical protein
MLLHGGRNAKQHERHRGGNKGFEHAQWAHTIDPHHRRGRVTDHAAGTTSIGCSDDGGEIADMHFAAKYLLRHAAADEGRGDVVEKTRDHGHNDEQHEATLPVIG